MYNTTSLFHTYHLPITSKSLGAAHSGTVVARRRSPVLSQQELRRLISDMVD